MGDNEKQTKMSDNVLIIMPPIASDNDEEANDYIDRILENAKDSIEKAKIEQEELAKQESEKQAEQKKSSDDVIDKVLGEEKSSSLEEYDLQKEPESQNIENEKTDKNPLRTLTGIEKILIILLMSLPGIQLILMIASPAIVYFVYSAIALVFVAILSHGCKQYSMVFVHIAMMVMSAFIIISGFDYGMQKEDLSKRSVLKISYLNSNTPMMSDYEDMSEDEIFDEFTGKFIYLYKYGCSDCAAIDASMKALFEENKHELVSIETRSDIGKKMLELFPVDEVPAGVILHNDGTHTKRILHTVENEKVVIDNEKMGELINALEKEMDTDAPE